MGVSVDGGAVTVRTNLPLDRANGFNGACAALIEHEPGSSPAPTARRRRRRGVRQLMSAS